MTAQRKIFGGKSRGGPAWRTGLAWLILLPLLAVLVIQLYFFLQIWWWVDHNPETTSFMRAQLSALQEKNPKAVLQH